MTAFALQVQLRSEAERQQHTAGPWHIEDDPELGLLLLSEGTEEPVALLGDRDDVDAADLRLIAAAPDLLAAVRHARLFLYEAFQGVNDGERDVFALFATLDGAAMKADAAEVSLFEIF